MPPPPIRYPAPLRPGARLYVTAPSSGVEAPLHPRLDLAIAHLRSQGFVVEEGRCLRSEQASASASAEARASELMQALLRDDIDAVYPPWGGELAIELLDRLDWSALQQARPKWLIGYSDTSTLQMALLLRLGWAGAHGPPLMDQVPAQRDPLTAGALAALATQSGASVLQQASTHWQLQWTDFEAAPASSYQLTEPTAWRSLNRDADAELLLRGRLVGGCIDTLMHLAGSPFGDLPRFVAAHRNEGTVLFLENAEQSPTALVRALHRLRWAGWFEGLAGLLVGRSAAPDTVTAAGLRYADALQNTLGSLPFPVLADVDIGHRPPQFMIITGALAELRWSVAKGGSLRQRLS